MEITALLARVRNYLDITWEDAALDEKLTDMLQRGMNYLNRLAGEILPFTQDSPEFGLLMNYCLYERANQLDMFQRNYIHELNALQLDSQVNRHAGA